MLLYSSVVWGQCVNKGMLSWKYLPVTYRDFETHTGNCPSLSGYEDSDGAFHTDLFYLHSHKGNVSDVKIYLYRMDEKFGTLTKDTNPYDAIQIYFNNKGGISKRISKWSLPLHIPYDYRQTIHSFERNKSTDYCFYDTEHIIHEYDSKGHTIQIVYHSNLGSSYDKPIIFKYKYASNSENISQILAYDGNNGKELGKVTYDYDSDWRLVGLYGELNTGVIEYWRKDFKYDEKGNLTYMYYATGFTYTNDLDRKNNYYYDNEYDSVGNLVKVICRNESTTRNRTTTVTYTRHFNYDKYGNWTEMTTTSTYPKNIGAYIKRTFNYRSE